VDGNQVGTGPSEGIDVPLRLDDHQVHMQRKPRHWAKCLHHERPDGDVGHKASIHHVDVDHVRSGLLGLGYLRAQATEICG